MFSKLSVWFRWSLVGLILTIAAFFMLHASRGDSGITDELAHIPAGYSYLKYLDYRLNPEHPPLVKILAGLPLLFQNLNFPTNRDPWAREINGQWGAGAQFLYESGNDADQIISLARIGPILLTLFLILLVYIWSKDLIGRWWALLPTFLTALSPTILAHGHYVTTDVGAALGIFVGTMAFLKYLESPSKKRLIWAGLAFGVAQLLKFSAILLIPFFLILTVVFYIVSVKQDWKTTDPMRGRFRRFGIRFYKYFRSVFVVFFIGYVLVFVVYIPLTLNYPAEKQITDTEFLLGSFAPRFLPDFTAWLAGIPVIRAFAEYLLGFLMVSQRTVGGNTAYFLGDVSNQGWWYYFPMVFLMKEPLPSLIMIFFAILLAFWGMVKSFFRIVFRRSNDLLDYFTTHFSEFAMLAFIVVYWTVSMRSNLNIGVRHLLPTLPFIYILTAGVIKNWFSIDNLDRFRNFAIKLFVVYQELTSISIKTAVLAILIIWQISAVAFTAPFFLSYFNPLSGGIKNGYQYAVDSNYDWGQDLKRLAQYVERVNHDDNNDNDIEKIAVDYFGAGNPRYYLGEERVEYWWSARGNPLNEGIKWLAVSINTIQGAKGRLIRGLNRKPEDEYQWLTEPYKSFDRAGTSIFIYKLAN